MKQLIPGILFLALILASCKSAHADDIPPGCYVADYYRSDPCWTSSNNIYLWNNYPNRTTGALTYGSTVEAIINAWGLQQASTNICLNDYSNLATSYNNNLIVISAQSTLIKKLRRKCGSPCRKLK